MNGYQIVSEALLFNQKDTTLRLEDWKQGKIKNLYLVGYLGSGKSTTAKELAKKYNAKYIELDQAKEDYIGKYWTEDTTPEEETKIFDRFLDNLVQKGKTTKQRIIYEGIDVIWIDRKYILSQAVVIKETSVLISSYRAWLRDIEKSKDKKYKWYYNKSKIALIKEIIKNQRSFMRYIGDLRKDVEKEINQLRK